VPRLVPKRASEDSAPAGGVTAHRIVTSLLVVQGFRDAASGIDYRPGDRAQLRHRSIRLAALAQPELFAAEFATEPVDLVWLADLHQRAEEQYLQAKLTHEGLRQRKEREEREELEEGKARKRDSDKLERRYAQEQERREEKEREQRELRERQALEATLDLESGFHYADDAA
jgi:hypothetical protein